MVAMIIDTVEALADSCLKVQFPKSVMSNMWRPKTQEKREN